MSQSATPDSLPDMPNDQEAAGADSGPRLLAPGTPALPLHVLRAEELEGWLAAAPPATAAWLRAQRFGAGAGAVALLPPAEDGALTGAVAGLGDAVARARGRFALAAAVTALPAGAWRLEGDLDPATLEEAALGWLFAGYRFDRFRPSRAPATMAQLVAPDGCDRAGIEAMAAAEWEMRDLINRPASDLDPSGLEAAAHALAAEFGANVDVTTGDALLAAGFPLIHTVGRAGAVAPRLIDLRAGDAGPRITLVGKGVCFDTGGLDLKSAAGMGLMKKDMAGAAVVLGLARLIFSARWPVRLRVLVPAVENAVASNAFRPGDILTSRKGLTVEVNNTDAEGRLILADALALAAEEAPEVLISVATLTGAARVAVGPDLAPFYCDDDGFAAAVMRGGQAGWDPVWRMPFWPPYEEMIEPGIADLDNAPAGGHAGSITAALFLRRFAEGAGVYAHLDIYGWQPKPAPGRPKGGAGQGARALFRALPEVVTW